MTDFSGQESSGSSRPADAGLSPFAAVAGTFTKPGATFESLIRRPTWWLPLVLWIVMGGLSFVAISSKVDWEGSAQEVLEKQAAKTGRAVPAESVPQVASVMRAWALISTPVLLGVMYFAVSLVLWGGARAFGGELRYPGALALWGHASLVNTVGGILSIATFLNLAQGSVTLQGIERVVKSNPGFLLGEDAAAPLYSLVSSLDVFSLGTLALLVVGFRRIPALSKGTATALPIVLWVVYVAGKTALAFLRG